MGTLWTILKFIAANILLLIVSSTLIGFIVRGILQPGINTNYGYHKVEYYSLRPTKGRLLSLGSACLSVIMLITLYYYTNFYIALGVLFWMLTRIKDLIREIKTGIKTTKRTMTNSSLDFLLTAICWAGFITFNYGLYLLWIKQIV